MNFGQTISRVDKGGKILEYDFNPCFACSCALWLLLMQNLIPLRMQVSFASEIDQ